MLNYVTKEQNEYEVYACFSIENDKLLQIGEKSAKISPKAYLNCYNWDALLYHYMEHNAPDLLIDLDTDVEEDDFIAIYQLNDTNLSKVDKFIKIIQDFVENEESLFDYIKTHESEIDWD